MLVNPPPLVDFLTEYKKLQLQTPRMSFFQLNATNSDYCFNVDQAKNLYLVANAVNNQDSMYGRDFYDCADSIDCDHIKNCTLCFGCINCRNCYNCNHLQDSENSTDCNYGYYLKGCKNCTGCAGLNHKEFYIFNQPYSKEEYFKKLATLTKEKIREGFEKVKRETPRINLTNINSENVIGNCIYNSKNIDESYDVDNCEDSGYLLETKKLKNCYDITVLEGGEQCYQISSSHILSNCNFCYFCVNSNDLEYCEYMIACENCFGCVSLHRKKYHILNQPYSKEDYFKKVAEIKAELRAKGLYGKMLLPPSFPRQETVAVWEKM